MGSCDGNFCIIQRAGKNSVDGTIQTCITGARPPNYTCSLDYEDSLQCYCKTDFCNTNNLFHSNVTVLPIIECREVFMKEYRAAACNKCIWKIYYESIVYLLKMDKSLSPTNPKEEILCSRSGQSAAFSLDSTVQFIDRIGENFYDNSCYNISMHPDHYVLYCRCNTVNCNDPTGSLPYPIPPPTISCYVSGYDAEVNNAKYDTPELSYNEVYSRLTRNESYYDEGINCRGHFCFIVNEQLPEGYRFYKGCMSSHEQGENKIQLGYNFVNDVPYYVCNTDFCNLNIVTALDEARNETVNNNNSSFKFSLALYLLITSMK
ncbi:unnamed protein product [Caenorhabditis brenneri]